MSTILVVEDEPLIRDVLEAVLADEGYTVVTAGDGQAALEVLTQGVPDLVLMDVMMPRMDGPTTYQVIRSHAHLALLPVILMSAVARPADLDPAITAFLRKPFDVDDLLPLIARVLASRQDQPAEAGAA
jgi:two-component system response regulator MprA